MAALSGAVMVVVGAGAWWLLGQRDDATPATVATPSPSASAPSPGPTATPSPSPTAAPALAWGPPAELWEQSLADARQLTVEEAAGQVIVAAIGSPDPAAADRLVSDLSLGGVIVMGDAVTDAAGVRALTSAVRSGASGRDWPAIVSVDQEGGVVSRLRAVLPDLPGFMAAGAARDKEAVRAAYGSAAADMRALGFTVDFAPVADVTIGLDDPTIRTRSAGGDPTAVADTVVASSAGYVEGGIVPVIKHFPGHGSVTVDSHLGLPRQDTAVAALADRDLVPFAAAIGAGLPVIMMGHIAVPEWGDEAATLEPASYAYLRDELGFGGVIVTDAMNMGAIQETSEPGVASARALAAGADIILLPPDPRAARDAIVAAVESGDVPRERLDEAAARAITLARWQESFAPSPEPSEGYASALAAAGATVAAKDCEAPFVSGSVSISGGFDADRAALAAALEERGVAIGTGGTAVVLMGGDAASGSGDVVVAMGGPWGLSASTADVYVGLYGRSADALAGLADVLTGAVAPGGEWPVEVDVPYPTCG
ncbi:glycoside hydrolase family 3 N-terminal domain-containing protein [Demequina sp. NBRC 110056]|uniref:glycoside hydrolase family 3 N-terminal domain-containing protein n=1 Tax=Demequina sp. NBRC 110056 TaxID=1570345 RepID=UPI0011813023|nr:glycoside hydrolase family 3 N-terminal domain-containing protein [Demequina sp. NBRC 110056]